ncbi:AAA family ATPase [Shewanella colwelliana]|uniref:AAA family ATPase n=1 Tax=Shewanella colwelliana TaxID=23 RepID=UPI0022AF3D0C|nr:SMC family ATPase [Shewanella colwelliana]MCZ4338730.1 SMC family ATPase [Shewanella colwelliana]
MRPLSLTMVAFGPFSTKQVIDFKALGTNPLFLINGPTGAGKTTILDAICFALYGKTTGDEREGAQMRCDMASDELLTEVNFSFQLGERHYHIRRVPEQPRAKKSGDGYTLQKPEAQLTCIEADGSENLLVAAKVSEATTQIEQLTGLDVDQFRQVMVLPQGKFRELLMADSKAREKIFSQLFQTHIYRQIEDKLKQQALGIKKDVEAMRNRRDGVLQGAELESDEALANELETLAPELDSATAKKAEIDKQVQQVNQQLEQAKQLSDEFSSLAQLNVLARQLDEQKTQNDQQEAQLLAGRNAKLLQPVFQAVESRKLELTQASELQQKLQRHQEHSQDSLNQSLAAIAKLPDLEAQQQQILTTAQQRRALLPQLQQLEQLKVHVSDCQQQMAKAELQGKQTKTTLAKLNDDKLTAQARVPQLKADSQQLLVLQQQISDTKHHGQLYAQWLRGRTEIEQIHARLLAAKARGAQLNTHHEQCEVYSQTLTLRWHQGQAAILAAQLSKGEACPVCGSLEHPQLAQSEQAVPTDDEREAAQANEQRALTELTNARSDYRQLKEKLKEVEQRNTELGEQLPGIDRLTQASVESTLAQLEQQFAEATKAQQQLVEIENSLLAMQQQELQLNQQLEQEREYFRQREKQFNESAGQLKQLQAAIPPELANLAALEQEITKLEQTAAQLKVQISSLREQHTQAEQQSASAAAQLQSANETLARANEQYQLALSEFERQLQTSKFDSLSAFQLALLTDDKMAMLAQQIKQYEQQCITNQANIAQLTAKLADSTLPDIAAITERKTQRETQQQGALNAWQQLSGRMRQLAQTAEQLKNLDRQSEKLEAQYAVVGTLSDVANGNTGNKISLQRFVLSVLLDDVLLEASQRLQLMSKGRYRLLRKEDRAKGNKASGLELEVEDAYTAKVRSVATLSGGESFMAALSMALGLSDVVQAYAGGIKLDTLFIDEGFGSLDQDSLELAIRTLMDLQSAGRMVGVISHVTEMKEQIASRIDIVKTATGSEVELVLP